MKLTCLVAMAGLIWLSLPLCADTTIDPYNPYAFGANLGWVNARGDIANGAVIGHCFASGHIWSANAGWICMGNGPTNGWSYSNATPADWGVNHDGTGKLSGYAYGANIGWITFEQAHGKPKVDLFTGTLSGFVWSANAGWLSLSNTASFVQTVTFDLGPDSDADGIPDAWEYKLAGNLDDLGGDGADWDGDGASDLDEAFAGTDPFDAAAFLAITAFSRKEDTDTTTWTVEPTRLYRLMQADQLAPSPPVWTDSGLGLMPPGGGTDMTADIYGPGVTQRFYRVQAIVPLSE